ncbi:MAG TPA: cation:proton antiporter [Dyella sp.]
MIDMLVFLLQAMFIVALPPLIAYQLRLMSMVPLVVVQILFGVVLGPSCFGRWAPAAYATIFSPASLVLLSHVSAIALLFFALVTGMHLDFKTLRGDGRALALISGASMLVPSLLGFSVGMVIAAMYPQLLDPRHSAIQFAVAIGICCGVTALPVLAAILRELDLLDHRLGQFALTLAAANDGALWIVLAVFLAGLQLDGSGASSNVVEIVSSLLYFGGMLGVVRPWLARYAGRTQVSTDTMLIIACVVAILSAAMTEWLGLHYLLGAFIAGTIIPTTWRSIVLERIQPLTVNILLPFFFIVTGLKVFIDAASPGFLEITVLLTLFAVVGKIAGTALTARMTGESWRFSLGLGALAQAKGLMEIVVATILLDVKVISPTIFSAVLVMALISTTLAMPMTRLTLARHGTRGLA